MISRSRLWVLVALSAVLAATMLGSCSRSSSSGGPPVTPAPARPDSMTGPTIDPLPLFTTEAAITVRGRTLIAGSSLLVQGGVADQVLGPFDARAFEFSLPLRENRMNRIVLTELFADGTRSPAATADIVQDRRAPTLQIDLPADQSTVFTDRIQVLGRVADTLTGQFELTVDVNGQPATVYRGLGTNGTFRLDDLQLPAGTPTEIIVQARDAAGNVAEARVTTTFMPPNGNRVMPISGNLQEAEIHRTLPEPLVVQTLRPDGSPLVGKVVRFAVTRSDGRLATTPGQPGTNDLSLVTDASGFASAYLTLGSDAGSANNRVVVTSKDLNGAVTFLASALPGPPTQINVSDGDAQVVAAGGPALQTLRAWVSDGCNGVAGVPVRFSVLRGAGRLSSATEFGLEAVTVDTGPTGHADVTLTTGEFAGLNEIVADFVGNPGATAVFTVTGLATDHATASFVGTVTDNSCQPIEGATCVLKFTGGAEVTTTSDAAGHFTLGDLPATGAADLYVHGDTAIRVGDRPIQASTLRFPDLHYEVVVVDRAENSLPAEVKLPRLDPQNDVSYDGTQDVTLTCAGIEGLQMIIRAGSMTLPDGTRPSQTAPTVLAINQVHHDELPMVIPDGAAPPFAWTLQPAGALFDPPIEIRYPNMSGLPAGAVTNFLSFDHDTGQFEIVATGLVSPDGADIVSEPNSGLTVSGWGCNCPPYAVTGDCQNCFDVAVVLFQGGPGSFNSSPSVGSGLRTMAAGIRNLDPQRITTEVIGSSGSLTGGDATEQLTAATQWLASLESPDCPKPKVALIGHSLGGDTVRFSDGIMADVRVALDPITRADSLNFPANCVYYQRGFPEVAAPSNTYNFLATGFTGSRLQYCIGFGCIDFTCLRGYRMSGTTLQAVIANTDHSSIVPAVQDNVETLVGDLLPTPFSGDGPTAFLDESFTLTVGGRSLQLGADGFFHIQNIPAPDAFGAGGPGTAPDFLSDDYLRVTGNGTFQGAPCYVFSEPFQIRQGRTTVLNDLTFTSTPPPMPTRLALSLDRPALTSQFPTANAQVLATLPDGSIRDFTQRTDWTIYRTSDPAVATVGENGLVTAVGDGVAVITATNEGVSSVARIEVRLDAQLTTVVGFAQLPDGTPVVGASLAVIGQGATGTSGNDGRFEIPNVLATQGSIALLATATVGGNQLRGSTGQLTTIPEGFTDAGIVTLAEASSAGTDFLLAFPANYDTTPALRIFIAGEIATFGQVQIPGLGFLDSFQITPGVPTTIEIPSAAELTPTDGIEPRGIFITTGEPVCVYGLSRIPFTTDAYSALPIAAFGTEYRLASYDALGTTRTSTQFAVAAPFNATTVTITPSTAFNNYPANQPYTVTLQAGEVYQLAARSGDVTGTLVTADQPIGVFGSHRCANVPSNAAYCDHLVEMLPPVATWGTQVHAVSLGGRQNGDTFRILAKDPATTVTVSGTTPLTTTLQAGEFHEAVLDGTNTISATGPIMVLQYANGGSFDGREGDPFMMLLPWQEQFQSRYTFTTPASGFANHWVNVIAPTSVAGTGGVLLDGTPIDATAFSPISTSGWSGARIPIGAGSHTLVSPTPVGIYVYGWNDDDSYGYPGGMKLSRQ
ncbi:MAG: carboxypeptidase regulatory-like domain-containing protein [bacterium]|nr:carboxypeptidase regulatory-like domain-containing protein [bacterium]